MNVDLLPREAGRMTTAEMITMGVAIAGALGTGALLQALVGHFLNRDEKKVNLAEKLVQTTGALLISMEAELKRAQAALADAEQESKQLRAELGLTTDPDEDDTVRVYNAKRKLRAAYAELTEARNNIHGMRVRVGEVRESGGFGRGLARLIPNTPAPTPRPVDDARWEEFVRDAEREEAEREARH